MISWQAILIATGIMLFLVGLVALAIKFPRAVGIPCLILIFICYVISMANDIQKIF